MGTSHTVDLQDPEFIAELRLLGAFMTVALRATEPLGQGAIDAILGRAVQPVG